MQDKKLGLWNPMKDRIRSQKAINKGLGAGPQDSIHKNLWKEFSKLELTLLLVSHTRNMYQSSLGGMGGNPYQTIQG